MMKDVKGVSNIFACQISKKIFANVRVMIDKIIHQSLSRMKCHDLKDQLGS